LVRDAKKGRKLILAREESGRPVSNTGIWGGCFGERGEEACSSSNLIHARAMRLAGDF